MIFLETEQKELECNGFCYLKPSDCDFNLVIDVNKCILGRFSDAAPLIIMPSQDAKIFYRTGNVFWHKNVKSYHFFVIANTNTFLATKFFALNQVNGASVAIKNYIYATMTSTSSALECALQCYFDPTNQCGAYLYSSPNCQFYNIDKSQLAANGQSAYTILKSAI